MSIARRYGRAGNETETVSVSRKAPKSQSQSHGETDETASLRTRLAELERRVTELEAAAIRDPIREMLAEMIEAKKAELAATPGNATTPAFGLRAPLGARLAENEVPWLAEGISKATWYRRKKAAQS